MRRTVHINGGTSSSWRIEYREGGSGLVDLRRGVSGILLGRVRD